MPFGQEMALITVVSVVYVVIVDIVVIVVSVVLLWHRSRRGSKHDDEDKKEKGRRLHVLDWIALRVISDQNGTMDRPQAQFLSVVMLR